MIELIINWKEVRNLINEHVLNCEPVPLIALVSSLLSSPILKEIK